MGGGRRCLDFTPSCRRSDPRAGSPKGARRKRRAERERWGFKYGRGKEVFDFTPRCRRSDLSAASPKGARRRWRAERER